MNDEMQPAAAAEAEADVTSEDTPIGAPKWFRNVAVLAIVWNLLGCASFVFHLLFTEAMLKDMTPKKQEWVKSIPSWIYIFFFLSVAPGTLGSIGLLIRKSWATPLFAVSLVSVVIQMGYTMFIVEGSDVLAAGDKIMSLVVIALAGVLLWLSMYARKRGWMSS